jgi:hypothetical protein
MTPEPTVAAYGPDSIAWLQQQPANQSLKSAGFTQSVLLNAAGMHPVTTISPINRTGRVLG